VALTKINEVLDIKKEQILDLYLNQIFLGNGSYGVAAAALNYFGKSLSELDLAEMAYLAALPKALQSVEGWVGERL